MIDDYFNKLLALSIIDTGDVGFTEYFDSLLQAGDVTARELLRAADEIYLTEDKDKYIGLLEIGYFRHLNQDERILAFLVCIEVGNIREAKILRTLCEPYSPEQLLFQNTSLYHNIRMKNDNSKDRELIDMQVLEGVSNSEIVKVGRVGYAKINPLLTTSIPWWSKQTFPNSKLYVRLNHHEFFASKPLQAINEEILIPANPSWWNNLEIYKNRKEGSSYYIEGSFELPREQVKYIDYHVDKVRSLQIHAKRNNDGNLSMMLEELNEYYFDAGFLMGRCIHLDTDSGFGTSANQAMLNHLDLAIQFYEKDKINARNDQDLSKGMVVDASFRTHLFRVENIPFNAVIAYAGLFFKSKYLVQEWLKDQLRISIG
jgi:hypothetical protein